MSDSHRYEIKFVVNDIKLSEFFRWMWTHTAMATAYPDRIINSVYFDDAGFQSVRDNLAGLPDREKFRLRWYSDEGNGSVKDLKLEKKVRVARLGYKKSAALPDLENSLLTRTIGEIQSEISQQFLELGLLDSNVDNTVFPALHANFVRQYFQDPEDIRVTIDSDINFYHTSSGDRLFNSRPLQFSRKIIELKFHPALKNSVATMIRPLHLVPKRCSKYLHGVAMNGTAVYL
jgi:SPX domain protein involved in polyphosphate accumulation